MLVDRAKGLAHHVEEIADKTPDKRERHVDLVRALAIGVVVIGHWLAVAVTEANGEIDGINALVELGWAHPLTWLLQVMPLFFFIGGYANSASIRANRKAGGDALGWVLSRFERIVVPTTALLATLVIGVAVARAVGMDLDTAATGAWLASIPLWFLAAYLAVLALAPMTEAGSRRFGFGLPVVLVGVVVLAEVASMGVGWEAVGDINHLVVWLVAHQLGYHWRDGSLPATPSVGIPMAIIGGLIAVALVTVGPYPTSMVGVPGDDVQNTAPPTAALLALGIAQIGIVLAVRDSVSKWLQRARVWKAVVAVNAVILTLFLWHMAAALVAALALYPTGVLPVLAVDSWQWLALRPVWLVACAAVLVVLVAIFGAIEAGVPGARKGTCIPASPAQAAGWFGVLLVLVGMLSIALAGDGAHGPLGLPTTALVSYTGGGALLAVAARGRHEA